MNILIIGHVINIGPDEEITSINELSKEIMSLKTSLGNQFFCQKDHKK